MVTPAVVREPVEPAATTTTVPPLRSFSLAFTGDLLLHQPLTARAALNGRATGRTYDYGPMFDLVRQRLSAADVAICHLETPLSRDDRDLSTYPLFSVPFELADAIAGAGYDGCSTASNHAIDAGRGGVDSTLDHLDRVGLRHSGTARAVWEAWRTTLYDAAGVTVGHLSYTYGLNGLVLPGGEEWRVNLIDAQRILGAALLAEAEGAEYVVVSLHWGVEYVSAPTPEQRALAQLLLASPHIDLVIGHHAHVVQPVEQIGSEYVVYGLGNFLSNQGYGCCSPSGHDGLIATARVHEQPGDSWHTEMELTPTMVELPTYTVAPISDVLTDPALSPSRRAALQRSFDRTTNAIGPLPRLAGQARSN